MSKQNFSSLSGWGIVALLTLCLWYSYSHFAASKQTLVDRSAELDRCNFLVGEIQRLRARPDQATLSSHSARALAKAIEQSSADAKITSAQIASIEPQTARRKGDTAYMEHATVVQLGGITLAQFGQLAVNLRRLDASLGQLHLTTVRIDAPYRQDQQQEPKERWNVEFTLTYFVYSPKSSPTRAS